MSFVFEELLMGADFEDFAFFEHEDFVCFLDGGEAVGDDDGGAAFHEFGEGALDGVFAFGVDG